MLKSIPWVTILLVMRLSVCQAARSIPGSTPPPKLAQPDFSIYHKKDAVFQDIQKLVQQYPDIMRIDDIKRTDKEYESSLEVVTVEPGGLSFDHQHKYRLLLNFGEHGRELITVEMALHLLHLLADPDKIVQRSVERGNPAHKIRNLLHSTVFKIVPMENVHGREVVEAGNLCERKNGRGVDTNRNWDLHWGFREKDYDPSEEYGGTHPFSEPEAAALLELAQEFEPHVWMNAHSGMEALFMPYDHKDHIPEGEGAQATLQILQLLNQKNCGGRCAVGSGGKSVGYLAHGTATDYMYEKLKVPLAFTWEIYGDQNAHYNDCFRMFNPLTKEEVDKVVDDWVDAVFVLLELLPGHPNIPPLRPRNLTRKIDSSQDEDLEALQKGKGAESVEWAAAKEGVLPGLGAQQGAIAPAHSPVLLVGTVLTVGLLLLLLGGRHAAKHVAVGERR
eukprot:jgi/Botrbrau1/11327/Bobra.0038s0087.2